MPENLLSLRDAYEKALNLYFSRSFREARRIFSEAALDPGADKAALLMVARCDEMLLRDAPPDWDGVFVYTTK